MKKHLSAETDRNRRRGPAAPPVSLRPRRLVLAGGAIAVVAGLAACWWLASSAGLPPRSVREDPDVAAPLTGPAFSPQATIADLKQAATEAADELSARYPNLPGVWNVQAALAFHLGNTPEAKRLWEQCLTADPQSGDAIYGLGYIALLEGDNEQALERFQATLAVNPEDERVPLLLAECLTHLGRPEEAAPLLQQQLEKDPHDLVVLLALGQVHLDLKQYEQSRDIFERAIRVSPNNRVACYGLARSLARLGKAEREKARQVMAQFKGLVADERQESSTRVLNFDDLGKGREVAVLIFREIAKVYVAQGDQWKAEEAWMKATAVDPHNVSSRLELAAFYEQHERLHAALRVCLELRNIEPANAAYWSNVGMLQAQLGRYDDGLAAVEEAIKLDPANSEYRRARELILSAK